MRLPAEGQPMKHAARLLTILALAAAASTASLDSHARQGNGPRLAAHRPAAAPTSAMGAGARFLCRYGIRNGCLVPGSPCAALTGGFCLIALIDAIL